MHLKSYVPTMFYIRPMTKFIKGMNQKDLVGAEIGVSRGYNALSMLRYLPMKKMYLVDTSFVKPLDQLLKYDVVFIEKPSVEASKHIQDGSLDFVYIDASHNQKEVEKDINAWHPKIKREGVFGGHDYDKLGVKKAIEKIFSVSKICCGFNLLLKYVEDKFDKDDRFYYSDPEEVFKFCKNLAPNSKLFYKYLPHDFTVLMWK